MSMVEPGTAVNWNNPNQMGALAYKCGFCGNQVGGERGWFGHIADSANGQGRIYICPTCTRPTLFLVAGLGNVVSVRMQFPSPSYGDEVQALPADVQAAYAEARACYGAGAYSATVLLCRKLLMHVAVEKADAAPGKRFLEYIDALEAGNFIVPPMKPWVDRIRTLGNNATHELPAITKEQAEMALDFSAMLLKTLYEYPARAEAHP